MSAALMLVAHAGDSLALSASAPSRRMLPIAQVLDRMPGLSRTQKAVLNQVCGLAENGQRKQCDATNPYLAARLRPASERTVSRTLTDLEARGLLRIEGQGKARRMWPVEALRACYLTADEGEQEQAIRALAAVANLDRNLDKTAPNLDTNLDKTSPQPRQNGEVAPDQPRQNGYPNLDTFGHQPRQNGSRVYRDDQYEQVKEEEKEALRCALAAAEKKIGELEQANQQLAADLEEVTHQRNQLRNSLAAVRPASSGASASHTRGAAADPHKMFFAQSRYAMPEGFAELARRLNYPAAYAPHYLAHIGVKAGDEQRDEKGWQNFVQRFLANDATSETGLITTPPNDSAHAAQRSTFTQQRPVSGAKPTSTGSQLARALAERRAGLSGAGAGHHGPATGPDAG